MPRNQQAGNDAVDAWDVSIIIVSRNTRELLRACLASVAAHAGNLRVETIVVESGSADRSAAMVRREFPAVTLLDPGENLGYARGNNLGIRRARGASVLILNPDTELTPGALPALAHALHAAPDIGVVGPRLRYPDGQVQSSRRRFPTLMTALIESTVVGEWWPAHPAIARYRMDDTPDDAPHDVDWLVGACLLVRRAVFATAGLLDARIFLYAEEPEWCWRVRRAGWRVRYVPEAEIRHYEGASTAQVAPLRQRAFMTSRVYLMGRLYGPAVGTITRTGLVTDQSIRLLREGAKWVVGHKRAMRAARIGAAWATLRALLAPWERMP